MTELTIIGNLLGEIEVKEFINSKGKEVMLVNFILRRRGRNIKYLNCIFYTKENLGIRNGDLVQVKGYYSKNRESNTIYRDFIVNEINHLIRRIG